MRVSPEIESLIPYKPGKPIEETKRELGLTEVIKLASNENPLGPSPKAVEAIKKGAVSLGRYPDPTCFHLRQKIAQRWQVRADDIVIGNGSNELIDLLIRVFCEPGDKIITPQKSFVAYSVCAQAARVGKEEITVDKFVSDFKKDHNSREKILFLANPNNPTGSYLTKDEVERLLNELGGRKDILVVFDEAYNEYVRANDFANSEDFFKKYDNVLICRTFSKIYGLAGLRVGALIGSSQHLQWINRVRNPFNVNQLAQDAALAAMDDHEHIKKTQQITWDGLDDYYKYLEEQKIPYFPSQTNFVLFDSLRDGKMFFQNAMRKGLLVRPMGGYGLPRHIRLSVGTPEENQKAKEILNQVFLEVPKL